MSEFGDARLPERFWSKAEVYGTCWMWSAYIRSDGYGEFSLNSKPRLAHRVAYEALSGHIPDALCVDHLCRVRCCVNPRHMELVTRGENVLRGVGLPATRARQTHCKNGHPLSGDNLRLNKRRGGQPHRQCKQCRKDWADLNREKLNAKQRAYTARKSEQSQEAI